MRTIYIDSDFKCRVANDGTMRMVETDFFDGKCDTFVEGYRFVPTGESWTRSDGMVFSGAPLIVHWKPLDELEAAQAQYERDNEELQAAYQEGVNSAYD